MTSCRIKSSFRGIATLSLFSASWEEKCSAVNSDVLFTVDFDLREESGVSLWRVQAVMKLPEHEQGTGNSEVLTGCREAKALGWCMPQVRHRCGACSASPELCSLYAGRVVWWLLFLIYSPGFISLTDFTQELLPVVRRQPGGDFYVILGNPDVSCCSSWTPFNNV